MNHDTQKEDERKTHLKSQSATLALGRINNRQRICIVGEEKTTIQTERVMQVLRPTWVIYVLRIT